MRSTVKIDPEKLVRVTTRACLTIEQLSAVSDLHRSTIYNALAGKNVRACTLGLIAKGLCVDPTVLIQA